MGSTSFCEHFSWWNFITRWWAWPQLNPKKYIDILLTGIILWFKPQEDQMEWKWDSSLKEIHFIPWLPKSYLPFFLCIVLRMFLTNLVKLFQIKWKLSSFLKEISKIVSIFLSRPKNTLFLGNMFRPECYSSWPWT